MNSLEETAADRNGLPCAETGRAPSGAAAAVLQDAQAAGSNGTTRPQNSSQQEPGSDSDGQPAVDNNDGLDEWIIGNIDDAERRTARVALLVAAAKPFQHRQAQVLMAIGSVFDKSVD